jgi:cell division protease FtsH
MSERLGPVSLGKNEEHLFLGREVVRHREISEKTAQEIDAELKEIVSWSYERARAILTENLDALHSIANMLLKKESLDGKEIDRIIGEIRNKK